MKSKRYSQHIGICITGQATSLQIRCNDLFIFLNWRFYKNENIIIYQIINAFQYREKVGFTEPKQT
jgi:hypothetical protein